MISDGPDEDADNLDDDTLMREYLGIRAGPDIAQGDPAAMPDWPRASGSTVRLDVDSATITWFMDRHADWRKQMQFVLRAWAVAQDAVEARESPDRAPA